MQFVHLVDFSQIDPKTGEAYVCKTVNEAIALDGELNPDPDLLIQKVSDEFIRRELTEELGQWRSSYLPLDKDGKPDPDRLGEKISASLEEAKTAFRRNLVLKNDPWVRSAMPFLIQQFRRGLFQRAGHDLVDEYSRCGGQDDEKGLVRKTMLFYRVLETCNDLDLAKPDGGRWKDEDEIWQTWVGYAGSEAEAKRICRTLNTVCAPLAKELDEEMTH